jgi:hypothetical protein
MSHAAVLASVVAGLSLGLAVQVQKTEEPDRQKSSIAQRTTTGTSPLTALLRTSR